MKHFQATEAQEKKKIVNYKLHHQFQAQRYCRVGALTTLVSRDQEQVQGIYDAC